MSSRNRYVAPWLPIQGLCTGAPGPLPLREGSEVGRDRQGGDPPRFDGISDSTSTPWTERSASHTEHGDREAPGGSEEPPSSP